ncbi:MAG TPA: maleylpyruvate isomerase N-terminal domain-containing protein [Micromonosporaceae bacterium]
MTALVDLPEAPGIEWYLEALRREGGLLVEAFTGADLDASVPTCPEWNLRELGRHVGRVHRWAAAHVRDQLAGPMSAAEEQRAWGAMPDDDVLGAWLAEGHQALVETLARADPELACWAFLPAASPLAFWARRQAHETAIHRVDAQTAAGLAASIDALAVAEAAASTDPMTLAGRAVSTEVTSVGQAAVTTAFAVDGIDELLLGFFARPRNRVRSDEPRTMAIIAEDADASWFIQIGPDGARPERGSGPADTTVRATASELYLGLWNRIQLDQLSWTGEASGLTLWRTLATVRWS